MSFLDPEVRIQLAIKALESGTISPQRKVYTFFNILRSMLYDRICGI
jgi:hypothetical protein